MQPDNDQIIKEIGEAEQYLKGLLRRLLDLNASPRSLSDIVQALEIVSHSYASESGHIGGSLLRRGYAVGGAAPLSASISSDQQFSESTIEQIRKALKDADPNGINT